MIRTIARHTRVWLLPTASCAVMVIGLLQSLSAQDRPKNLEREQYIRGLVVKSQADDLHTERYWHLLLHYRSTLRGYESEADGAAFFLANNGKTSPQAELEATIRAFFTDLPEVHNLHPICRFPARYQWLQQKLELDPVMLPRPDCSLLKAVQRVVKYESASLVFSSYYLNAPASMFGHTLLKINATDSPESHASLLDYAINYAAYPGDLDPFSYAFLGLTGGYPGKFTFMPYHIKVREYNDVENRDLWEYKLNLKKPEIERLILHTFELTQTQFNYFYLDENCSYHLLSLLEVARPKLFLTDKFHVMVLPGETIKEVVKNEGLVNSIYYRPSLFSENRLRIKEMPPDIRELFFDLFAERKSIQSPEFTRLSLQNQALLIDTLLDALRYLDERQARSEKQNQLYQNLIEARTQYPHEKIEDYPAVQADSSPPHLSHDTLMIKPYIGSQARGNYFGFQTRVVFHDLLNTEQGVAQGSVFEFFKIDLRYYTEPDSWELNQFTFLKITSLVPYESIGESFSYYLDTGIHTAYRKRDQDLLNAKGFNPAAFNGLLTDQSEVERFPAATIDVFYGLSYADVFGNSWMQDLLASLMIGGRIQQSTHFEHTNRYAPGIMTHILYDFGWFKMYLKNQYLFHSVQSGEHDNFISMFEVRYNVDKNHEVRLGLQQELYNTDAFLSLVCFF
ncbi:MAG: DUF4105 domain-containing protein [Leptospiraceae bacterium]|nr:DUF4105 domain-containing protein [Leptospiraceae bacterium]